MQKKTKTNTFGEFVFSDTLLRELFFRRMKLLDMKIATSTTRQWENSETRHSLLVEELLESVLVDLLVVLLGIQGMQYWSQS
jgi:hypothetical protein